MQQKKILFIGNYPNNADRNLYIFFRNLIHAIADKGVECYVIAPVSLPKYKNKIKKIPKYNEEVTAKGNKVYVYYPRYISASAKKIGSFNTIHITSFNFINAAYRQAKKTGIKFDAVYGHFFLSGGLASNYIGKKFCIPAFVAYGECDYESQVRQPHGDLKRNEIDALSGIISVSQKNTQELKGTGLFESVPILTCMNAIDHELFSDCDKKRARKEFSLPEDDFIVGFVGSFIDRKGDKRLLEACRNLQGVSLAYAGRGSDKPKGKNVVFCDSVNHDEIGDFLSAVDAFCLPTLNEGCCNAVLEAMAAGKAIISSDLPFNDGVLTDENSIRINPNSIDEIRDAVTKLRDDKSFRETIANKAKEDSKNFTIEKRAEKILDFIKYNINKHE